MVPLDFLVPRRGRCRLRPRVSLLWMLDADDEVAVVSVEGLEWEVRTGTVVDGGGEGDMAPFVFVCGVLLEEDPAIDACCSFFLRRRKSQRLERVKGTRRD